MSTPDGPTSPPPSPPKEPSDPAQDAQFKTLLRQLENGEVTPEEVGFKEMRDLKIWVVEQDLAGGKLTEEEAAEAMKSLTSLRRVQNPWFNMDSPVDFGMGLALALAISFAFSMNWKRLVGISSDEPERNRWFSIGVLKVNLVIWLSLYGICAIISWITLQG